MSLKLINESDQSYLTYLKDSYAGQLQYVRQLEDLLANETRPHIQDAYEGLLKDNYQILEDYRLRYDKARRGNE